MSNPGAADATAISSIRQLADHIAEGCKPAERFSIGTEHEKFGFRRPGEGGDDFAPPPYEPRGIRAILATLAEDGWEPIADNGNPIGLARGDASVSLEPAGQHEL
jgi:glutamate--cysteine ligase